MVTGVAGTGKGLSFQTTFDIDERVRQSAALADDQRFVVSLAMVRLNTGRLLAHVDRFGRRSFAGESYLPGDGAGGLRIHFEIYGRPQARAWRPLSEVFRCSR